jgi:hypothetical protein
LRLYMQWFISVIAALCIFVSPLTLRSSHAATPPALLLQTGQATCYDVVGDAIPCPGSGQDGALQAGAVWTNAGRFTDNSSAAPTDLTITDNLTGLIWAKDSNAPGPLACAPATTKTWQAALDYIACLNSNNYLTRNDWRLPNPTEMESLVNIGAASTVTWLDLHGFTTIKSTADRFWTSSSLVGGSTSAWYVTLGGYGGTNVDVKTAPYRVWPVRTKLSASSLPKTGQSLCYDAVDTIACSGTGQDGEKQGGIDWPNPRFSAASGTIITDNLTGLMWTKDANVMNTYNQTFDSDSVADGAVTWQHAHDFVKWMNKNTIFGYNDWRLPNVTELESKINRGVADSAVWLGSTGQGFSNIRNSYWSSSTNTVWYDLAWIVDVTNGKVGDNYKNNTTDGFVWPVRGGTLSSSAFKIAPVITTSPLTISNLASGTISFSAYTATDTAAFTCSLDGSAYTACVSPFNYKSLADGQHTFSIIANESSNPGNVSAPVSVTWKVDAALTSSAAVVLPQTGQTTCYITDWTDPAHPNTTPVACADTGQDGETKTGLAWPTPRFVENSHAPFFDKTITDSLTGLIWTKSGNMMTAYDSAFDQDLGSGTANDGLVSWQHALDFVKKLNTESYLGYTDWRLPNPNELASLINKEVHPLDTWLFGQGLTNSQSTYWSSTSQIGSTDGAKAWTVNLNNAGYVGVSNDLKSSYHSVWPVRSSGAGSAVSLTVPKTGQILCYDSFDAPIACSGTGQDGELQAGTPWPVPRFVDNSVITSADKTVTDRLTGLIWVKDANLIITRDPTFDQELMSRSSNDGFVSWQSALDYVKHLNTTEYTVGITGYLGHTDWRLPNSNELESLANLDQRNKNSWLRGQGFTAIEGFTSIQNDYWSSSTYAYTTYSVWGAGGKNIGGYVLPVRSGTSGSMSFFTLSTTTSRTFPATASGTQSAPVTYILKNSGVSAVVVSGITTSGANADQFGVTTSGTSPYCASLTPTLASGASCMLDVIFKPTSGGAKSAALQVISNDANSPTLSASLTGVVKFSIDSPGSNTGGSISCTSPVSEGASSICTVTPSAGYALATLTDNSADVKSLVSGSTYTISNVAANHIVTGTFIDRAAPSLSFSIPAASASMTVTTTFTASDNDAVTGYCLSETNSSSGCVWSDVVLKSYTFGTGGTNKILYAFVKDAAGNISSASATTIVDTTPPLVTITAPLNNAILSAFTTIEGTASDSVSQIAKVEVRIASGNEQPAWIPAIVTTTGTASWSLTLSNTAWIDNTIYTVHARAYDTVGNVSSEATVIFTYRTTSTSQAFSQLSFDLSSAMILQGGTISVGGKLTRLPDNGSDLSGQTITLTITAPDASQVAHNAITNDAAGHYRLDSVSGFSQKGAYTLQASFTDTPSLTASSSPKQTLLVGSQAGYAIIVQGKIPNGEGLASHAKTANRIYKKLKARGLNDDGIFYLSYQTTQDATAAGVIVDRAPDRSGIQDAITSWAAGKLKAIAAPLYIILVDHGTSGNFIINTETITPADLNSWLTTLETTLSGTPAAAEKRVVINGSCFSGSFIPALSKAGRVIITSAAANEESYKGPLEPDGVRSGEFFLDALFQHLGDGHSFSSAFETATLKTRQLTRQGGLSANGASYSDGSVQHPLLDDDGNARGSNTLALADGDGAISKELYLGVGTTITNSAVNPQDLTSVTPTTIIPAGINQFDVRLTSLGTSNEIASAWAEVRVPGTTLNPGGTQSGQLTLDLPKVLFNPDATDTTKHRWSGTASLAALYPAGGVTELPAGMYEVYYYARNAATLDISPLQRSVVYKQKNGNNPPTKVNLTVPASGSSLKTVSSFEWTAATDPENDLFTYTLEIATDAAFTKIVYKEEELAVTATYVPDGTLKDLTSYYWRITAIDQFGASSTSAASSFTTDNTNGLPALITGSIRNDSSGAAITNATVQLGSANARPVLSNGAYLQMAAPGATTLMVHADGYTDKSINVTLTPGKALTASVYLTPAATTKAGDCDSSGTVTIAEVQSAINMFLGLNPVLSCVNVDGVGGVTIAEVQKVINSFLGL